MNLNHISIFSGVTTVDESCWKAQPNPGQFVAKRLGCRKRTWHDLPIGTPKSLVSAAEKRYPNKHIKYSFLKVALKRVVWSLEFSLQVAAFGSHEPSSSSCSHPSRWDIPQDTWPTILLRRPRAQKPQRFMGCSHGGIS